MVEILFFSLVAFISFQIGKLVGKFSDFKVNFMTKDIAIKMLESEKEYKKIREKWLKFKRSDKAKKQTSYPQQRLILHKKRQKNKTL